MLKKLFGGLWPFMEMVLESWLRTRALRLSAADTAKVVNAVHAANPTSNFSANDIVALETALADILVAQLNA